jgi:hypothetical protein
VSVSVAAPLAVAFGLLAATAGCALVLSGSRAAWTGAAP